MRPPHLLAPGHRLLGWAAAASAGALSLTRIGDYDIWYHLRAGRLFLESGLPANDPFAYTATNQPLSVQSWLAGVVYHLAERVAGVPGVQVLNAILVATVFGLVYVTARLFAQDREDAPISAILVVVAAFAARFRLGARPHVIEYVLVAAALFVLQRRRVRGKGPLWILPLLQIVWVNVHGSHVLGVLLPLIFLAGELGQRLVPASWQSGAGVSPATGARSPWELAAVALASLAATLVNPAGWHALEFPFQVAGMSAYMSRIGEWQPLTIDLLAGYGARYTWGFSALLLLALLSVFASVRARRVDVTGLLLLVTFGLLAARGVRLIPEFAIATVPIVFGGLAPAVAPWLRPRAGAVGWAALGVLGVALALSPLDRSYEYGLGAKERIFPDRAIAFAERAGITGRVFNSFGFGDYLVHRAPGNKVYIHGRNEVFPQAFYEEYLAAHGDASVFRRIAERWSIDWILLEYTLTDYARREAMPHLASNPEWVPVYWDRVSALYVRAGGVNSAVAERYGVRVVHPAWFDFGYLDSVVQRGEGQRALSELSSVLELAPDNEEAWLASAYVSFLLGRSGPAEEAMLKALVINPGRAMTHSALGLVALDRGDRATARARFDRALELKGDDPLAIDGLRTLGVHVKPAGGMPAGHP